MLLDHFAMTTKQQTNLKFVVRLAKSPSEALYLLQQVYKEQTLFRSKFLSGTKHSKKEVKMLRMIPGVEDLSPLEMKPKSSM